MDHDPVGRTESARLRAEADLARAEGRYAHAADLFASAALHATTVAERLHLTMRQAVCRYNLGDLATAEQLARTVAAEARREHEYAEVADALALAVKARLSGNRATDTADELADALYALSEVIADPAHYVVVHNLAETFQHCELPHTAIDLYGHALRLADTPERQAYTQASLAAAHHLAMNHAHSAATARQHLLAGIAAADAAIAAGDHCDASARATAFAHRSLLRAVQGDLDGAFDDARQAHACNLTLQFPDIELFAFLGDTLATLHTQPERAGLTTVREVTDRARSLGLETYLLSVAPKVVEVLWSRGLHDDARDVLQLQVERLRVALASERVARWQHVRVGVNLRIAEQRSETDPLTGIPNRRFLERWFPEAVRMHHPLCVALLDLDGFKRVNDELGHEAGDQLLRELAGVLQRISRRHDAIVRIGGDEFVIVLGGTWPDDSRPILERIRQVVGSRRWTGLPDHLRVSVSIGAVTVDGPHAIDAALATADQALREAKQRGRNRIVYRS